MQEEINAQEKKKKLPAGKQAIGCEWMGLVRPKSGLEAGVFFLVFLTLICCFFLTLIFFR